MPKELYLKPEVTSEVLEPGALATEGSGTGDGFDPLGDIGSIVGICCEGGPDWIIFC